MRVAIAAYRLMVEFARADHGRPTREERRVLRGFRRKLGIRRLDVLRESRRTVTEDIVEGSPRERAETIRAIARVAYADHDLSQDERDRIHAIAARVGVGRVEAANLMQAVEGESILREPRVRAPFVYFAAVAALATVTTLLVERPWTHRAGGVGGVEPFRPIVERFERSVLFVVVQYDLLQGSDRATFQGTGTGFFVSDDGFVATNKHVVEPWKFLADRVQKLESGWSVDPDSVRLAAWVGGDTVFRADGELDFANAFDSDAGTLRIATRAADKWVKARRSLSSGAPYVGRFHALDNSDLVLLEADVASPVEAIPLCREPERVRTLDSVVVLGFPRGTRVLEGWRAIASPSPGIVRKVEDTIMINAPIVPGNSGGPLVDLRGEAIGIATRRAVDESLGRCIQAAHVRALLDSVR